MSFPKYDRYKDSGVEWLGEVPEHWNISRIGFESWLRARLGWKGLKAEEYVEDGFIFLATPNIKEKYIDFENVNYINEIRYEESPEIKLKEGDVLLAKDGSTLGTVNIVRKLTKPATVNSSIAVITPGKKLEGAYLCYLFQGDFLRNTIQRIKGGMGVPHLFQEDLNKFYIPLPPLPEQRSIATFLDRETTKIDELIAEQRQLIDLLKEKRQAVISHAVTKGLNPDAPMEDSAIEWLGEVPEHWEISSVKRLASICYGIGEPPKYQVEGIPLVRATNVNAGKISLDGIAYVNPNDIPENRIVWLKEGDIIVVRSGAYTGDSAIIPEGFGECIAGFDMVLQSRSINPMFMQFTLLSKYLKEGQIDTQKMRSAQPHLNAEELGSCLVALPPLPEQRSIAAFLDRETTKLDELIAEAQHAIALLRERRTALISAAVTGKIDVRSLV